MKIAITILTTLILSGCSVLTDTGTWVITSKAFTTDYQCTYTYRYNPDNTDWRYFEDSCSRYRIGDTIKFANKK